MEQQEAPAKEKIILPQNLQHEMIKFFLKTSIPKIHADKAQIPLDSNRESERVK